MQLLLAPLFKAGRLPFVAVHGGAAHEDFRAGYQRRHKIDHAAHDGDFGNALHTLGGIEAAALHLNAALRVAHGGGVRRFAAHHHSFEYRLTADVGAVFLFFLFFFVAHIAPRRKFPSKFLPEGQPGGKKRKISPKNTLGAETHAKFRIFF